MKKVESSITVFLCFVITMIISLVLSLTEISRMKASRYYMQVISNSAVDSMLSLYHRKLWDFYRIYGVEYLDDEQIKNEYYDYIKMNLKDNDNYIDNWFVMSIDKDNVDLKYDKIVDGSNLEKNIKNYMQFAIIGKVINFFGEEMTIESEIDIMKISEKFEEMKETFSNNISYKEVEKRYFNYSKDIKKIEDNSRKIKKQTAEINKKFQDLNNMKTSGTIENGNSVANKLNSIKITLDKLVDNLNKYIELMEEFSLKVKSKKMLFDDDIKSGNYVYDEKTIDFINNEFEYFLNYVNQGSEINQSIEKVKKEIDIVKNSIYMYNSLINDVLEDIKSLNAEKREAQREKEKDVEYINYLKEEIKTLESDLRELLKDIKTELTGIEISEPILNLSEEHSDEDEKIIDKIIGIGEDGLLSLAIDKEKLKTISDKNETVKKYDLESENNLLQKLLFSEYELEFFNYYDKKETGEITRSGSNSFEVEYLISGKESDKKNISSVILKILLIREAMNMTHLLTSEKKIRQARNFTNATFFYLSKIAREAIFLLTLTAWGMAQSVSDIKNIMSGKRVNFMHTEESWDFGIDDILKFGRDNKLYEKNEKDNLFSLNYKDYLRLLLFLTNQKDVNSKMCDLIEKNIKNEQESFSMARNLVSFSSTNKFSGKYMLINMIFMKPKNANEMIDYEYTTKSYGTYIGK